MASELASGNSGNIDAMSGLFESRILDNEKTLLSLPNRSDYDSLSQLHSSRFNTLDTDLTTLQNQIRDFSSYLVNLKLTLNSHIGNFTGHTGVAASSGHNGL